MWFWIRHSPNNPSILDSKNDLQHQHNQPWLLHSSSIRSVNNSKLLLYSLAKHTHRGTNSRHTKRHSNTDWHTRVCTHLYARQTSPEALGTLGGSATYERYSSSCLWAWVIAHAKLSMTSQSEGHSKQPNLALSHTDTRSYRYVRPWTKQGRSKNRHRLVCFNFCTVDVSDCHSDIKLLVLHISCGSQCLIISISYFVF